MTSFSGDVTAAIGNNPGGGTLGGTTTVAAVSGVATFSTLSIDKAGTGYTLVATAGALAGATSATFDIVAGTVSGTRSTLTASPTSITASSGSSTSTVTVTARDAHDNPIAGASVSLAATGSGNTLSPASGTTDANGVFTATFSSTKAETKTLSATINGVGVSQTASVTVTASATLLAFTVQPTSTAAGATITPAVQVSAQDEFGNTATDFAGDVTVTIGTNPGGGTLAGTTTVAASGGVATFSTLSIDKTGTGYTLTATATGLASASSTAFNITAGTATKYIVTAASSSVAAGNNVLITAQLADANNNPVATSGKTVTWSKTGDGGSFASSTSTTNSSGVAEVTFTVHTLAGTVHTVTATDDAALTGTSGNITVVAGPFTKLQLLVPGETAAPGTTTGKTGTPNPQSAGAAFSVTVNAVDTHWNVVTSAPADVVRITSTDAAAGLPADAALSSGTRSFSVTLNTTGDQTLTASDLSNTAIAANTSPAITVYSADGSGTNTVSPSETSASSTENTLTFTYTAATGGMNNGAVEITVPSDWSAPSLATGDAGYTTVSTGTVSVSSQVITVTGLTLAGGASMTVVYGSKAAGGPGATAGAAGTATFTTRQRSIASGTLTPIAAHPSVTVYAADGSGTNVVSPTTVTAASTGNTLTFTYTAATGGMNNGAIEITVPATWSVPSTTDTDSGYTTASTGTVNISVNVITVSGVTLTGGATMTITYGDKGAGGPGATAPLLPETSTFTSRQRSLAASTLTSLAVHPTVTVQ
ncbi:MAG: Ig-like domain-containing protein [Gemmatimonadetes bacterium]|nr:Ig-like domain-containing protein [Gemmatimonadota bacterium]